MNLKSIIKKFLLRYGYEVSRSLDQTSIFNEYDVDVVFDIGANDGQFGQTLRARGYKNKIVSFEPLSSAHNRLLKTAKEDKFWHVHPQAAVGSQTGRMSINIANNSQSSSLKKMLDIHVSYAPDSSIVGAEEVDVISLNECYFDYASASDLCYLKIDTQGSEMEVLKGANNILDHIDLLEMEMSVVELYEDSANYMELFEFAEKNNFILWGLSPAFMDDISKRLLQFDAVFVRKKLLTI